MQVVPSTPTLGGWQGGHPLIPASASILKEKGFSSVRATTFVKERKLCLPTPKEKYREASHCLHNRLKINILAHLLCEQRSGRITLHAYQISQPTV